MAGEDQERFEDYLELERYIEDLQSGRVAHPPADLTPDQARIYRMAVLFRSVSSAEAEPRPAFVVDLYSRLLAAQEEEILSVLDAQEEEMFSAPDVQETPEVAHAEQPIIVQKELQASPVASLESAQKEPAIAPRTHPEPATAVRSEPEIVEVAQKRLEKASRKVRPVSRRSLLTNGAVAAASLVVGTGIGTAAGEMGKSGVGTTPSATVTPTLPPTGYAGDMALVPKDIPTMLHPVIPLAELGQGAVRFTTGTLVGYVIRRDSDDGGGIIAMSAACTHMGCIVQWQDMNRSFRCPCHGGAFTQYGVPDDKQHNSQLYLKSLPPLDVVIEDGIVYVRVPYIQAPESIE